MPRVSIVTPLYNAERFVSEALDSALAQTFRDFEIIVIDDGSTDRTAAIVGDYVDRNVRYFHQENEGLSGARNTGIRIARGEYIALLDGDDVWLPDKLEQQVALLDLMPEVALVYSDCYIADANGRETRRYWNERTRPHRGYVLRELLACDFVPCPTAIIRMSALRTVGLFDPALRNAEDYDLFLRIAESFDVAFVDAPLAKYRVHEGCYTNINPTRRLETELAIMKACLERHPEIATSPGTPIAQRFAEVFYALGKAHYYEGNLALAKSYLGEAIAGAGYLSEPFAFRMASLLGTGFVRRLRALKSKARQRSRSF